MILSPHSLLPAVVDIAARLSDEEILAISSYLEGLHNRADAQSTATQP